MNVASLGLKLDGYTFVNGKANLDQCYICHENKAAIRLSQQQKNPIYCCTGTSGEYGFEVDQEYDHHTFTLRLKAYQADKESELAWLDSRYPTPGFITKEIAEL